MINYFAKIIKESFLHKYTTNFQLQKFIFNHHKTNFEKESNIEHVQ